jgi:hypothetical protein
MQEIHLELTIDDVNLILEAAGALPFARVYGLIGKIQEQAARQLKAEPADAVPLATEAGKG